MRLKYALSALGAVALVVSMATGLRADIPSNQFQSPSPLSSANPLIYGRCGQGQSTAVIQALATTIPGPTPTPSPTPPATPTPGPTSTPIAAIFTAQVWTAADIGNKPGPTTSPFYATPAPTFSGAPAKVYVSLASDQWVFVQLSFTQGVVPVTITCSASVARVTQPGASGAPGPAGPTGPPGSPGPAGTISPVPSGSPPIIWNSTTNVASINLGPCFPVVAGQMELNLTASSCSPTNSSYDGLILSEASATHFWKGNDASGCTTIADAIAGGATAVPSPVPLTTPTPGGTPGPYPVCGFPSITNDGETSIEFPAATNNGTANVGQGYFVVPAVTMPTSGSYTIEWVDKSASPYIASGSLTAVIFELDGSNGAILSDTIDDNVLTSSFVGHKLFYGGSSGAKGPIDMMAIGVPLDEALVYNSSATTLSFYVNCELLFSTSQAASGVYNTGSPGGWGGVPGANPPFLGRMAKLSVHNTALSQTTLCTHTAALGL
jgi:hypothetical protein